MTEEVFQFKSSRNLAENFSSLNKHIKVKTNHTLKIQIFKPYLWSRTKLGNVLQQKTTMTYSSN